MSAMEKADVQISSLEGRLVPEADTGNFLTSGNLRPGADTQNIFFSFCLRHTAVIETSKEEAGYRHAW